MAQKVMYPGMVNSPETTITNGISESDTIIYVLDPARVPEPPNLMTLGTGTNAETVKVTEINDNALTVERGFQGIAKSWPAGTVIARNFTAYDYDALRENIEDLEASKETPAGAQAKAEAAAGAVQAELDAHLADTVHIPYAVATGSANTYAVTISPAPTSYVEGFAVAVKINVDNTGASTLNVNGLGAKAIKKPNGLDVSAGNLKAGSIYTLRYNGTNFILQGEGGGGTAQPAHVLSGYTFTNDQGEQTGTMPNRGAVIITPSTVNQTIVAGYHNGSGYVKGDANLVARNIKKGVSIFGVSGSVKPGWVLFAANGLYYNYNWGSFVAGYADGTPSSQRISNNAISLSTGSSCGDVAMVTNDPIDLTGIDYVCAVIRPDSYAAQSTYLIADTNKVAPYSTYVARVSGASDASGLIQGLVLNVSSLSGLYYIRLHLAATSRYIYCYLVSLG